jgi:hypothetical protein
MLAELGSEVNGTRATVPKLDTVVYICVPTVTRLPNPVVPTGRTTVEPSTMDVMALLAAAAAADAEVKGMRAREPELSTVVKSCVPIVSTPPRPVEPGTGAERTIVDSSITVVRRETGAMISTLEAGIVLPSTTIPELATLTTWPDIVATGSPGPSVTQPMMMGAVLVGGSTAVMTEFPSVRTTA